MESIHLFHLLPRTAKRSIRVYMMKSIKKTLLNLKKLVKCYLAYYDTILYGFYLVLRSSGDGVPALLTDKKISMSANTKVCILIF